MHLIVRVFLLGLGVISRDHLLALVSVPVLPHFLRPRIFSTGHTLDAKRANLRARL